MPLSAPPLPNTGSPAKPERNNDVDLTLRPPVSWLHNSIVTIFERKKNHIDPTFPPVIHWVQNTVVPKRHLDPQDDDRYVRTLIVDEIEQFDHVAFDRDLAKLREETAHNNVEKRQLDDHEGVFSAPRWWGEVTHEAAGKTRKNRFELDLHTATSLTMVDSDLRVLGRRGTVDGSSRDGGQEPAQYDSRRSSACVLMGQEKRASIAQPLSEQLRQRALKSTSATKQGGMKFDAVPVLQDQLKDTQDLISFSSDLNGLA